MTLQKKDLNNIGSQASLEVLQKVWKRVIDQVGDRASDLLWRQVGIQVCRRVEGQVWRQIYLKINKL